MKLSYYTSLLLIIFHNLPSHDAFSSITSLCDNNKNCAHFTSQSNRHRKNNLKLLQSTTRQCSKPSACTAATTTQLSSTNLDFGGGRKGRGRGGRGRGGRGRGRDSGGRVGRARGGNDRFGEHHSSSQQRGGRNRDPDMRNCKSIEELVDTAYDHKDIMSHRGMSAFWTLVSKLLQRRGRPTPKYEQMQMQIDELKGQTLQQLDGFGYRDIATIAISLAKIAKKVDKRGHSKGSPQQIMYNVLIGTHSSNKQFIFNEVAYAAVPLLHKFDARHLSNLIYAFGLAEVIILVEEGSTFFDSLAHVAIPNLPRFNGQDLSNMLWAYGNMEVSNPQLFKEAGDAIVAFDNFDDLDLFKPQHLSNILWAFATLGESHAKLFKKVVDHISALDNLDDFKPQELSNIVWAYATAGESHPTMFKKIGNHIIGLDNLNRFDAQAFSNILWAYATAGESHPKLFKKVADHIVALKDLDRFDAQALSNILWAYATAGESHPKLFQKVGNHIASLDNLNEFIPQHLSNIVWAFATANESHPKLFRKVGNHIATRANLDDFKPQELSNIAWAYATAKESHPALFQKLSDAVIQRQDKFIESQHLANFLWAYATTGQVDKKVFTSLVPTVEANLGKYNEQDLANIAWAYAVANVDATHVLNDEFINACMEKENEFINKGLSQLHQWQLWQEELESNVSLPPSLYKRCNDAFISRVPEPSMLQDDVISQLSSIGLELEEEVLNKSGYRLDALVEVNGNKIGIEVDGPSHFLGRSPTGSTILKHRQVTSLDGIPVVSVPYWEWKKLNNDSEKKQQYLRDLLGLSDQQ